MTAGDRLLGDMTRPEHAYALGVIAGAGTVRSGVLEIELRGDGQPLLGLLAARTASDIPAQYEVEGRRLRVHPPHARLSTELLGAEPGNADMRFPSLAPRLAWAFVRGLFDATGSVSSPKSGKLELELPRPREGLLAALLEFVAIAPTRTKKRRLVWGGSAALDLLGLLYGEFAPPEVKRRQTSTTPETVEQLLDPHRPRPYQAPAESLAGPYRQKNLERFWAWSTRVVGFASDGATVGSLKVQLVHSGAVVPRKERVSDSGYDLTLLYEKSRHGNVVLYGTGIIVEPPFGWYFDVVARSSIVKRGYMLANNVGIIDRSYRGEILVPLLRTDPQARELELPARIAQLIPRPIVHLPVEKTDELSATHRGAGGFGSTG